MRAKTLALVAAVAMSAVCLAAPPTLKLPDEIHVPIYAFGEVKAEGEFEFIKWKLPRGLKVRGGESRELIFTGPPGSYEIWAWASNKDGLTDLAVSRVTVGDGQPTPEPGPTPKPTPPQPPKDIPFPGVNGLHVLIVYESADLSKYSSGIQSVMFGKRTREWMDANCVTLSSGRRAWNIWDKDVDASGMGAGWVDALKRKRDSLPWLIASNGKTAIEIPLPTTEAEFIEKVGALK